MIQLANQFARVDLENMNLWAVPTSGELLAVREHRHVNAVSSEILGLACRHIPHLHSEVGWVSAENHAATIGRIGKAVDDAPLFMPGDLFEPPTLLVDCGAG